MQIALRYISDVDLTQARHRRLKRRLLDCQRDFPNLAEGIVQIAGIQHFFCYSVEREIMTAYVAPRDFAEAMLNQNNHSTHEPWSPLPGRRDKHWGRPAAPTVKEE